LFKLKYRERKPQHKLESMLKAHASANVQCI